MIKHEIWLQVLKDTCGCSPGYGGNMPCDNGVLCDKCLDESVQEEYHRRLCKLIVELKFVVLKPELIKILDYVSLNGQKGG